MYLFFYVELTLNDFEAENPLLRALERLAPKNIEFFGPKWHSLHSLPFQGPKKVAISKAHPFQCPS